MACFSSGAQIGSYSLAGRGIQPERNLDVQADRHLERGRAAVAEPCHQNI
jgi:hypothetical protein